MAGLTSKNVVRNMESIKHNIFFYSESCCIVQDIRFVISDPIFAEIEALP